MSYFDSVNDKFFNPFCCKNREVYFECISQLIDEYSGLISIMNPDFGNRCSV